jgi:bifunctional DNA-binding transcriptional regulator/antitoxin component of YhaV-PrlF toxin-antitoxin module
MDLQNTATAGTGKQVIVPRKLYKELGLRRGEYLKVERHGREITLKPEDVEHAEILEIVAKGRAEFKAGKGYGPFDTAEDAIAFLHASVKSSKKKTRKHS